MAVKSLNARSHKRLRAAFLVKYETGRLGESPRITNIRDLSAGGLRFFTRELLEESSRIKLQVLVPSLERSLTAQAKILRVRRANRNFVYSVAVQFADLKPGDREDLAKFIETLDQNPETRICIDQANVVLRNG